MKSRVHVGRQEVLAAIESESDFTSTKENPYPTKTADSLHKNVAAVLAGAKPAAVVPVAGASSLTKALVAEAKKRHFGVRKAKIMAYGAQPHFIVSRNPQDADAIVDLYRRLRCGGITLKEYDVGIGHLLGYSQESMESYLQDMYRRDYRTLRNTD